MNSNADEIQRAAQSLGFDAGRLLRLPPEASRQTYLGALRCFVPSGEPSRWWEHFPSSTDLQFLEGDGWRHITHLVPDADERVWFIAEELHPPGYSLWEANVRDVQAIIAECYGFEFSIIQQQFRWLICDTHHDHLVAVGAEVEEKLRALKGC